MNKTAYEFVEKYYDENKNYTEIAKEIIEKENVNKSLRTLRRIIGNYAEFKKLEKKLANSVDKDNKIAWRNLSKWLNEGKDISKKILGEQKDIYKIEVTTKENSILLVPLADLHLGGWGTDYKKLETITEEILNNPKIFITLDGDIIENAINMRNVTEVTKSNALPIELQLEFFISWLNEIKDKVLWAGWGNHDTMREEKVLGYSPISRIFKEKLIPYNKFIAHIDLKVGEQVYKIAVSHFFKGNSYFNVTHSQQRYMRFQGIDREITIAGHTHRPGFSWYFDGPIQRLALNSGTLHTKSGYAKRFFSLFTFPIFPVIELFADSHTFIPYASLNNWKKSKNEKN